MPLPVSAAYLSLALQDGAKVGSETLVHRGLGDLLLPSGQLLACDPFLVSRESTAFNLSLPSGPFPVVLAIAEIPTDERVAFATIRLNKATPISWEMLTTGSHDVSTLQAGHIFGYPVDSGTGCFMDPAAAKALEQTMRDENEFFKFLIEEMKKNYRPTWDWLNMRFGAGNLIAFSSGYGDGVYATYAGRDEKNSLVAVVTDFEVIPSENYPD